MRVRLDSIGCRLNIGEMAQTARRLAARGHRVVGPGDQADLLVFNTCAVTHVASRKSRKVLRQLRRDHPDAAVVATGCYADLSPSEVAALGVDLVVANADKDRLPEVLEEAGLLIDADPIPGDAEAPFAGGPDGRTRAFVKVQDGCDNRCTFCIVTVARGQSRSRRLDDVVREIDELVGLGYQEAVLTGVHLGSYLHDAGRPDGLTRLIEAILQRTRLPRLRLSSLEPWDLAADFFECWQDERLLPHLHLPLQSGCDATLRRMARHTSQAEFAELVRSARAAIPDVSINTDVIVGFPGECDAEFEDSIEFVRAMQFSRLHVFRYSPRDGTAAASMPGQVEPPVAVERSRRMHELAADLEFAYGERFREATLPVLWEGHEQFGDARRWTGLTGNYLRVVTDTSPDTDLHNRILPARLLTPLPGGMYGQTAESLTPEVYA